MIHGVLQAGELLELGFFEIGGQWKVGHVQVHLGPAGEDWSRMEPARRSVGRPERG